MLIATRIAHKHYTNRIGAPTIYREILISCWPHMVNDSFCHINRHVEDDIPTQPIHNLLKITKRYRIEAISIPMP
jgi:hypothetical protein